MRIESFHIQGYKSLADVKVEGLSDINVFYGLNGVGKSNIFEALALWRWILGIVQSPQGVMLSKQLETAFESPIFQLGGNNLVHLNVTLVLTKQSLPDKLVDNLSFSLLQSRFNYLNQETMRLTCKIKLRAESSNQIRYDIDKQWEGGGNFDLHPKDLASLLPVFHIIKATRRFQIEQKDKGNGIESVSDHNLKQALFYAYLSSDLQQKARLAAIKRILAEPPFSLGELDVALDPATDRIDIGFVRPEGRLPLESLGTGAQQLLLVLGQIFLNDYPIIAIEEPEMNLSPQYQQYLLVALRQLMQNPAVKLNQLFISTHSPYFEFEENFFDVSLDEQGRTQVARLPIGQRERYFPDTQVGPETGARLNSLNQIKLYDGVIKDLGLQRGDLVLFTQNEAGHWEIRPEKEIVQELETIFDEEN